MKLKLQNKPFSAGVLIVFAFWVFLLFSNPVNSSAYTEKYKQKKLYPVSQTAEQWYKNMRGLEITISQLRQTNLPSRDVSFIIDSLIVPLYQTIFTQVNKQIIQDTTKRNR